MFRTSLPTLVDHWVHCIYTYLNCNGSINIYMNNETYFMRVNRAIASEILVSFEQSENKRLKGIWCFSKISKCSRAIEIEILISSSLSNAFSFKWQISKLSKPIANTPRERKSWNLFFCQWTHVYKREMWIRVSCNAKAP